MKTYSAYKDSGVDWLGKIPKDWEVASGFQFLYENKSKNKGMIRKQVLSLSYGNIRKKSEEELTGLVPESFETYQFVEKGDIIFRPTDLQNDKVSLRSAMSDYKGIITSAYLNLRLKKTANSRFYHYFFRAIDNNKIIYGLGSGLRQNISYEDFRRFPFPFPFPPKLEQETISNFLDETCGKLDTVVAQKEKMIALLKERKQALIQNAVTRSLNENVPMRDSGVDWIGEIPVGWEVKSLKYILKTKLKYGANESGINYDPDLPRYIRITDFSDSGTLSEENKLSLSWKKGKEYLLEDGDILFARSGATVGKSYQFKKSMSKENHYSFAGYLIKASVDQKQISSDYLNIYTNSGCFNAWKSIIFNKATIENIGADKYSQLPVIIPPKKEQEQIVEYIDTQSQKIDQAVRQQEQAIVKLKEYKASLVDSCVLGKIKVG